MTARDLIALLQALPGAAIDATIIVGDVDTDNIWSIDDVIYEYGEVRIEFTRRLRDFDDIDEQDGEG